MSGPLKVSTPAGQQPAGAVAPGSDVEVEANGHSPNSVLGNLKAAAKAQQEEHTEEFAVGGEFGEMLKIKYKVAEPNSMDRFVAARAKMGDNPQMTELTCRFMAQNCICLTGYGGGGSWVLEDEQGIVRLEHRLAALLEIVPPNPNPVAGPYQLTAQEVILLLFGGNALAVITHGDELMTWMQNPSRQPDVGKSLGRTGLQSSPSALSVGSAPSA